MVEFIQKFWALRIESMQVWGPVSFRHGSSLFGNHRTGASGFHTNISFIKSELIFYKYGKTIYKEYKNDGYVKKIIKIEPPFKTMVHDYSNNDFVENIYYNFDNKSNSKSYTPIITNVNCIIMWFF